MIARTDRGDKRAALDLRRHPLIIPLVRGILVGLPFELLLDRQGTILYEGELDTVSWWDTLAVAAG